MTRCELIITTWVRKSSGDYTLLAQASTDIKHYITWLNIVGVLSIVGNSGLRGLGIVRVGMLGVIVVVVAGSNSPAGAVRGAGALVLTGMRVITGVCVLAGVAGVCVVTGVCVLAGVAGVCVLAGVAGVCVLAGVAGVCVLAGVAGMCVLAGVRIPTGRAV